MDFINLDAFNRTIVELKHNLTENTDNGSRTFNRTIVELKLDYSLPYVNSNALLIEPLWN